MLQKVIKVGNSAAVTIPKDFMQEAGINIGDNILMKTDVDNISFTMKPKKPKRAMPISKEFVSWTKKYIKKYRPMLEELAKK